MSQAGILSVGTSTPGVVDHLTGDTGGQLNPDINHNFNLLGQTAGGIQVMETNGSGSTITFEDRTRTTALVVDPSATVGLRGTFQTLTAACAAASAGNVIYVRPGTYTENFTWPANVNITSDLSNGIYGNVVIVGQITCASGGFQTISGVRLKTNGSNFLTIGAGGKTVTACVNCSFFVNTGDTGISFASGDGNSQVQLFDCTGFIGSGGILYNNTSAGALFIIGCNFFNSSGASASNSSAGQTIIEDTTLNMPISTSGTAILTLSSGSKMSSYVALWGRTS